MIHVYVIGDDKFIHNSETTQAEMGHLILGAERDMENSIEALARRFAPGALGMESVGEDQPHPRGGNLYEGDVGVRYFPPHAKFVHQGTGVYGPTHMPITLYKRQTHFGPDWGLDRTGRPNPAVGNVFKIPARGGRGMMLAGGWHIFRKQVTIRGQHPQPFLSEAVAVAERTEIPMRVHRLARDIARGL